MTYVRVCAALIGLGSLTNLIKPYGGEVPPASPLPLPGKVFGFPAPSASRE